MILYERYKAPDALKLRFHIRDKFGKDITNSLDYDPATGIGHCYVPNSDATIEYFKPGGYVEIDGHVNPSQEALEAVYQSVEAGFSKEVMDATIKKVEQDVRYNKGLEETEPAPKEG
jgi:hypothetical protein